MARRDAPRITALGESGPWLLLGACFAVSGATGLVLQVVWARQLTEIFGSSSLAIATVLATFMGGLALGAHLGGRLADRLGAPSGSRSWPLLGYAAAEAIVGLSALAIPLLLAAYRALGPSLWRALPDQPLALASARLVLAAAALLVPTTAMGATLPLLGRHITRHRGEVRAIGRRLGALYAANTGGALVGAAAAGFWLVQTIGVAATSRVAAATALAVACIVGIAVLRGSAPEADLVDEADGGTDDRSDGAASSASDPRAAPATRPGERRLALWAYGLSGAIAMALEVFFSRALAIVLGSSVYSFTLVLVVFLFGLASGAALAARAASRTRRPLAPLGLLFIALAAALVASHAVVDELPRLLVAMLEGTDLDVASILTIHALLAGIVIAPVALGLGAVMPFAMRAAVGDLDRLGRDVGRAYAANTVGAIAGAIAAGFAVLPLFGVEAGLRGAALLEAGLGAALAWRASRPRRRAASALAAGALAILALVAPGWNRSDFTAGLFRGFLLTQAIELGGPLARDIAFYRDGVSTTVSVERVGESWVLKNNGKVEASDRHDMPTQILVGLMPVLLHPGRRQSVFVVGYGSGVTIGAITQAAEVSRIDVAELEPAVLEAADRFFADVSHHPAADPRVHRFLGDGRSVLLASDRRYDVIVSEPSNPWIAGVASLFTADFYAAARRRLAPGGLFCQWAQLYELGPGRVKMIYRTFAAAFPHVYAFTPGDETTDTILIGSDAPIALDRAALARRMREPALAAELARAGVAAPEDLLASLLLGPGEIAAFTAGAEINTADNARLEHTAPRDLFASVRGNHFARAVRGPSWPYGHLEPIVTGLGQGAARGAAELDLARALVAYGRRREARTWLERAGASGAPAAATARIARLLRLTDPVDFRDPELVVTAGGAGPLPAPAPALFARGGDARRSAAAADLARAYALLADGRWLPAWRVFDRLPVRTGDDRGRDVDLAAAYAAYKALELLEARELLRPLCADAAYAARRPAASYYLGRASYGLGAFRDGVGALEQFADRVPRMADDVLARRLPARR
ncbi:MAG TPA: fused MFS/spermidine synthase [Kofleriaceae bacterium]|nr:fused MFS/spermidine synthase [Kofleriaceae bacterium]